MKLESLSTGEVFFLLDIKYITKTFESQTSRKSWWSFAYKILTFETLARYLVLYEKHQTKNNDENLTSKKQ